MIAIILAFVSLVLGVWLLRYTRGRSGRWQLVAWCVWSLGTAAGLLLAAGPYEVRKTVSLLVMPLGLVWLGLGGMAAIVWKQRQATLAAVAGALWLGLTMAGSVPLGARLVGFLQQPFVGADPFQAGSFDAVAVLGGGVALDSAGRIAVVKQSGDRVILGARLYNTGHASLLITTGPILKLKGGAEVSYPAAVRRLWTELGVPDDRILSIEGPRTTSEEIVGIARLVRTRQWSRVGVLTSAWHMRRALKLCRRQHLDVKPLVADFVAHDEPIRLRAIVPQEEGVSLVQLASWELLGALAGH
ncbi:MAG: YdcF family protein [Acidobacteria bacterium]|jgi:uncharacterized SAM-binding protein YcdF (DUF218 family)|nr:YdcF family protein [Acidobacteriota bacterium]